MTSNVSAIQDCPKIKNKLTKFITEYAYIYTPTDIFQNFPFRKTNNVAVLPIEPVTTMTGSIYLYRSLDHSITEDLEMIRNNFLF
jgi:hypothetical protein